MPTKAVFADCSVGPAAAAAATSGRKRNKLRPHSVFGSVDLYSRVNLESSSSFASAAATIRPAKWFKYCKGTYDLHKSSVSSETSSLNICKRPSTIMTESIN
ncbi:hypothetical protein TKK_0018736 [Trichogramma kaykai]